MPGPLWGALHANPADLLLPGFAHDYAYRTGAKWKMPSGGERSINRYEADLLHIAPRAAVRYATRLYTSLDNGVEEVFGQTANLSISGMLVRGGGDCDHGARIDFEIDLPDQDEPICGAAEVVRRADQRREWMEGFAARFLAFRGVGRQRLEAFILERATRGGEEVS